MKNPTGVPFEIKQIENVNFLGYELIDGTNGIRYELVNEPWVSLCAAAMSKGKRKLTNDYKVIYSDADYQAIDGKVVKYVPDWENLPVALDVSSLYDLIYDVDYNTFELTIYFDQWHEDVIIDTRQLENCSKVNLVYLGKPFTRVDDLGVWTNEFAVGNYGNYTMTVQNDQVPVEISGNIMVAPQKDTGNSFFTGLFICKNANVNIKDFGLQINPGVYTNAVSTSRPGWIYGERSNLTFDGKFLFYYWMGASDGQQLRPAAHVSVDKYTTVKMENNTYFDFKGLVSGTGEKWVLSGPYFYVGFHCNAVIAPDSLGSVVDGGNFIAPGDVDSGLIYAGGGFNYIVWSRKTEHLVSSISGAAASYIDKSKNITFLKNA